MCVFVCVVNGFLYVVVDWRDTRNNFGSPRAECVVAEIVNENCIDVSKCFEIYS